MPAYFNLILDTTGPQAPTFSIANNAAYTTSVTTTGNFSTSDTPTTSYQIKIWGTGIDTTFNASIQTTEGASAWIAYTTSQAIRLTTGDGSKSVSAKIRDEVGNETNTMTDTILLDTTIPVVTVGTPSVSKISKVATFDTATCTFQADSIFEEYQVRVVPATNSTVAAGTLIPTAAGSINTSGSAGNYPATTNITITIKGTDLETASAGDGTKIVKAFVRDIANNWSV